MAKKSGQSAKKFMIRSKMEDRANKKNKKKEQVNYKAGNKADALFGSDNYSEKMSVKTPAKNKTKPKDKPKDKTKAKNKNKKTNIIKL